MSKQPVTIGLDIGTTSIGAAVLTCGGPRGNEVLKTLSVPNPGVIPAHAGSSGIPSGRKCESLQFFRPRFGTEVL